MQRSIEASAELRAEARKLGELVLDRFRPLLDWLVRRLSRVG